MSNDRYFDLPATGDEAQEEADRERKRRTVSSQWSFRSQADRDRSRRPKVRVVVDPSTLKPFVNSNNKESQILLPSSPPSEVVRDLPALAPSVTETGSTEVPEDPNEFYNPDHYAGLHRGAPDLENCLACQYKAKKTAINAAISKRNNLIQRYHSLNSSTRSRVDELMQNKKNCATCGTKGHDMEAALEHVRRHASDFGIESWNDEETSDKKKRSPQIVGTQRRETNLDRALKFLGKEDMDPTEKAILRQVHAGKSYDDIVLAFKPEAKQQVIEGMKGKPVESPKIPEIAPVSRTKIDMDGNVVPWEQRDWIRHHTAELKKARALGDKKGIKLHQTQLAIHEGSSPVTAVVKANPEGKVWKTGIVSKEEAWASVMKADETGEPQCALGCNLVNLHKQCPEHGQLLFND
jgi:hypothetical protein